MKHDIDLIRQLLQKYYDGTSTPEEESRLADMLERAESLPDDLMPDKALFAALAKEAAPPAGLADSIMEAVDADIRRTSRSRKWCLGKIFASAAAAAAVVLLIFIPLTNGSLDEADRELTAAASKPAPVSVAKPAEPEPVRTASASPSPEQEEESISAPRQRKIHATAKVQMAQVVAAEEEDAITPEEMEAMRFAFETLERSGEQLQRIDKTIRDAGAATRSGIARAAASVADIR